MYDSFQFFLIFLMIFKIIILRVRNKNNYKKKANKLNRHSFWYKLIALNRKSP